MKNDVLARGVYNHPQAEGFINVGQYMFVVKDNKKYLAVRFINRLGYTVESLEVCIEQLDSSGNVLGSAHIVESGLSVAPSEVFTLSKNPRLNEKCSDIRVYVSNVISGNYRYELRGDNVVAFYNRRPEPESNAQKREELVRKKYRRYKKNSKKNGFLCAAVAVAILLTVAVNALQMAYEYGAFEKDPQLDSESYDEAE